MGDTAAKIRSLSRYKHRESEVEISPAAKSEIPGLHRFIGSVLGPGIAPVEVVNAVRAKQHFSIWKVKDKAGSTSGALAVLYLNERGLEAVMDGTFDSQEPDLEHLSEGSEDVAGIFAWCFVLKGKAKAAVLQLATWLDLCGWTHCPIFTNPVTPAGHRLASSLGFRPVGGTAQPGICAVL